MLKTVAEKTGCGAESVKKADLARLMRRLKRRHESTHSAATFEALQFLEIGIHGKWPLWDALEVVARPMRACEVSVFKASSETAEEQRVLLNRRRLEIAVPVLSGNSN